MRADTGGVFTGTGVDDGVNENLKWVLVGEEVDDLECVCNDSNGQELLAVVAALHHQAKRIEKRQLRVSVSGQNQSIAQERTCRPIAQRWASGPS